MDDSTGRAAGAPESSRARQPRRRFLLWIPAAVFGAVASTLAASAFRFLRPHAGIAGPAGGVAEGWLAVGRVAELGGEAPARRALAVEQVAGWSVTRREQAVFVLPRGGPHVVSAVCPHEGCEVDWDEGSRAFVCPCHDSSFDAEGARLGGPAERGLTRLHARVNGDVLEVRLRPAGEDEPGTVRG
jgi:Rieske Fe-S protein